MIALLFVCVVMIPMIPMIPAVSVVVVPMVSDDRFRTVKPGNATVEAATRAGIKRVQVVDGDGETVIAVRRSGLTDKQKKSLALYDNRTAELSNWDADAIAEMVANEREVLEGMFFDNELNEILKITPNFQPVGVDEQGRLDQKSPVTCPHCGAVFNPG